MTMNRDVYYLHYLIEQTIVQFDVNGSDASNYTFDDEYTKENHRVYLKGEYLPVDLEPRNLVWNKTGKVHLANFVEGGGADEVGQMAREEFKGGLLETAFGDVRLPDISVVQQQTSGADENKSAPTIYTTKEDGGNWKWNWKFRAVDADSNCLLECIGNVHSTCDLLPEFVDSHALNFNVKRNIVDYGSDCYADCRPCEIEDAEEHFDGEFEYDKEASIIFGSNLQDVDEINLKAADIVKEVIYDQYLDNMGEVDIQEFEAGGKKASFPHGKPTVVRTTHAKTFFYKWEWDFTAKEEEYECLLECQGSITITTKQSPNPKIPKPPKKAAPKHYATMAARQSYYDAGCGRKRGKIMRTNILYP